MVTRVSVAALLLVLLTACGSAVVGTEGGGKLASEPREVSGIRAVELSTAGRLAISRAAQEALTVDAEPAVLPYLTTEVVDGVLKLGVKEGTTIRSETQVVYRLSVPTLERLSVTGSGWATVAAMDVPAFRLEVTGSGNVKLDGSATTQDIVMSGSGHYTGDGLRSRSITARVDGSAQMVVRVAEKLDATITGSGKIAYHGDPVVTQNVTGSGALVRLS